MWASRAQMVSPGRAAGFPPNLTIVYPRASGRGEQAWQQLATTRIEAQFTITEVAVAAFSGDRWQTLHRLPLFKPVSRGES